jgi:hypothetical protein
MDAVQVPVTVVLPQATYDKLMKLVEGDLPPAQKIERVVNDLVQDLADGGLMLSGVEMRRIQEASPGAGPDEIIDAIEESQGLEDGQVVIKWSVDPTLIEPLQNIADTQGNTIQEVIQNLMDTAASEGWFYDFNPKPRTFFLEESDHKLLEEAMGQDNPTGTDVMKWLVKNGLVNDPKALDELFDAAETENAVNVTD